MNPTIKKLEEAFRLKIGRKPYVGGYVSLGIPELDHLIGKSITPGGILEIHGGPSSGKTAVLSRALLNFPSSSTVMYVDCDHSSARDYGPHVTSDDFMYARPKNLKSAGEMLHDGFYSKVKLFLVDSVNSIPETNNNGMYPHHIWLSIFMNELARTTAETSGYSIVTSQIRMGDKSASGRAVSRHASVSLLFERVNTIKRKQEAGCLVRATLLPNRSGLRGSTEFEILYPRRP